MTAGSDRPEGLPSRATPTDQGFTLVEVVVSLVLMGVVIAAILPAMWTAIRLSRFSDSGAKVEAVLGRAIDLVANEDWIACPQAAYPAKARTAASLYDWPDTTVAVTLIEYWDPTGKSWSATNPSGCAAGGSSAVSITKERTLQRVTIVVTSPDATTSNGTSVILGDIRLGQVRDAA